MKNNCLNCYFNDYGYCLSKDNLIDDLEKERYCYLSNNIELSIKTENHKIYFFSFIKDFVRTKT